MRIEIPQNKKVSRGGKNGGKKGSGFAIRRRRGN